MLYCAVGCPVLRPCETTTVPFKSPEARAALALFIHLPGVIFEFISHCFAAIR
jgi:hypothetical protein